MKIILPLLLLVSVFVFGQTPSIYFQNNAVVSLTNGASIYIQDGSATAIQSTGNSGFYIPDNAQGTVEWNVQNHTGSYTVPFISTTSVAVPVNINITSGGTGTSLKVSDIDVSGQYPAYSDPNSINRYWTLDFSNYSALPTGTVTLNYLATDVPGTYLNLVTKYFKSNIFQWTNDELASIDFVNHNTTIPINSYLQTNNSFHKWTLVNPNSSLPVELIYLEAEAINNQYIQVSWATDLEINNKEFEVERSLDGQNWTHIGTVDGHGNSTVKQTYAYNDNNVMPDVVYYYKLRQVDFNGDSKETDMVSAMLTGKGSFAISDFIPNPTRDNSKIIITTGNEMNISVKLYDILGQQLTADKTYSLTAGENNVDFETQGLAAGNYTAVISAGNKIYSKRLVVVRE